MSAAISPTEFARLQQLAAARLLTDTATIQRASGTTRDGLGGTHTTWQDIATVPCRLSPRALLPSEQVLAGRLGTTTTWTVRLLAGTDIGPADRLVIRGSTYQVVSVDGPQTDEVLLHVVAVRVF